MASWETALIRKIAGEFGLFRHMDANIALHQFVRIEHGSPRSIRTRTKFAHEASVGPCSSCATSGTARLLVLDPGHGLIRPRMSSRRACAASERAELRCARRVLG